jgi:F-box and WD-40 domain protein 1/11
MYKAYGWQADEEEVRRFEAEIRTRHEEDTRQQMESKRKAEESNEEERKVKEARRATAFSHTGVVPSSSQPIDISQDWSHDAIEPNPVEGSFVTATRAPPLFSSFPSVTSDEDETYPSQPNRRSIGSRKFQSFSEPLLIIQPKLTIVPSGYGYPRLNWAFLFKNRCRLEENWLHNRCIPFQIPHPNYPRESHRECIYTIQYSPKWLCSGSRDRTVRVWDIRTRRLRGEPLFGHQGSVLCLQFDESPDEDVIISGSSDASVIVWRFSTGEKLQIIPRAHDESVLNLRFSKRWLVTCSKDKLIKIWNRFPLETTDPDYPWNSKLVFGPNRAPLNHPHHPNYQPTWKIEDPSMSSGLNYQNPFNRDYNLKPRPHKWVTPKTLTPYTAVQDLQGHVAAVNAIQLHGNEIVSASGDRVIKLWNLRTAQCEKTFVGHQKGIACIQFDGETIVSGSSDQTIRVFDRNTQAEIATLRGHSALVRTVQATRNKIVSGSYDESVRIWRRDEETGSWIPGTVLRQAQTPILITPSRPSQVHAPIQTQQPMQMAATQQFHAHATSGGNIASVQMHQIQQVGPGMPGALAASQLLPSTNQQYFPQPQHHPEQQQDGHPTVPELAAESLALAAPAAQFLLAAAQGSSTTPITQAQHAATAAAAVVAAAAAATSTVIPGTTSNGAHRIFKLQFDARWIMCCSQDTRIMGWDFAADDESVAEASRFFLGDN